MRKIKILNSKSPPYLVYSIFPVRNSSRFFNALVIFFSYGKYIGITFSVNFGHFMFYSSSSSPGFEFFKNISPILKNSQIRTD